MNIAIDVGDKYGELTAVRISHRNKSGSIVWEFLCSCGNKKSISSGDVRSGSTKSCGCLRNTRLKTHGLSGSPLHITWKHIIGRCNNPNDKAYMNYGGRGIIICSEWKNNFMSFYGWAISAGWKQGLQIDRINNNDGYYPENCRIVTKNQNCSNTRGRVNIRAVKEYKGVCKRGERFIASICKKHIGVYSSKEDAAEALRARTYRIPVDAKEKYGEYACLNTINKDNCNG